MSFDNFMSFLQQLLTMVDPRDEYSIALGKSILESTVALAHASGKVDRITFRTMDRAIHLFDALVRHAYEYAGKPGDFQGNEQKRHKLSMILGPGC